MLQKLIDDMSFFVASRNVHLDSAAAATVLTDDDTDENDLATIISTILQKNRILGISFSQLVHTTYLQHRRFDNYRRLSTSIKEQFSVFGVTAPELYLVTVTLIVS